MMGQLDGRVALVTGAAAGIGAACARLMAAEGAAVAITDIDEARGRETADAIGRDGGRALFLAQNVTDEAAWPHVVSQIERTFGRLDAVVANAGIAILGPVTEMSLADWRRQQAVNVDAVFLTAKYTIPALSRAGGGSIVMMSSIAGLRGSPGLAGYSATKGAVRLFAKSMAMECAMAGLNIRVNSVHPGIIDTEIWGKMPAGNRRNAPLDPHAMAATAVPLSRIGTVEDVARAVVYLVSDASSYVTGSELVVDGGVTGGAVRRPVQ
ncbi:MAG: glucose 1-dehydrogenase [Hyphomicrobiales bacterium]|nr:glucose 1-dehydrogenase [Hyphomicrobiales bacterium]